MKGPRPTWGPEARWYEGVGMRVLPSGSARCAPTELVPAMLALSAQNCSPTPRASVCEKRYSNVASAESAGET